MAVSAQTIGNGDGSIESVYAWLRLTASVLIGTIGSVGLWSYVVALPIVQADFAVTRADASLAYTLTMIGFGVGAVAIGGLVDRFGIVLPLLVSTLSARSWLRRLGAGAEPHDVYARQSVRSASAVPAPSRL